MHNFYKVQKFERDAKKGFQGVKHQYVIAYTSLQLKWSHNSSHVSVLLVFMCVWFSLLRNVIKSEKYSAGNERWTREVAKEIL